MKKALAGLSCFLFLSFISSAQSIYSFEGLGSLNHQGMPNNVGMGEVGIGAPTIWHINTINPANLVYNNFSTFQLGVELDRRSFSSDTDVSGSQTDGGLRFLAYAFPIKPGKWSSSFGILPLSTVSYNTFQRSPIENAPNDAVQVVDRRGEGGLTNFFWANGFRINKSLSVGFKASYTFGSINDERIIQIFEPREVVIDTAGNTQLVDFPIGQLAQLDLQRSYSDLNFLFGLGYSHKISETRYLNAGVIFSAESDLNETITLEDSATNFTSNQLLPTTYGFGLSYQKTNHYTIGLDLEIQEWSNADTESQPYNNLSKIAFGLEWIPDFDNVNSYFKRAKYMIGFNRTRLPYIVNGQALTDFGINFGASLPVSGYSSVDLAFKWGQLGETANGLIKENYFKIVIGATINDRWFIKRRYD